MTEAPVRVPDNFDELQERLRNAWTKGKAKGTSNTALMNTSKMFIQMFMDKEAKKITPYQQAVLDQQKEAFDYAKQKEEQGTWTLKDTDGDGVMEWVNDVQRKVESVGEGSDLSKYEDAPPVSESMGVDSAAGLQPGPTPDDLQAGIEALGQEDQFGVLGMSNSTVLEKGPGYMQPEDEKRKMFASQEAAAQRQADIKDKGLVGTYGQPVSQAIAKAIPMAANPSLAVGNAVASAGNFFKENTLPKISSLLFGERGRA